MANVIDKVAGLVVGPQGPQGPQGPKGDTGQTGPQGEKGATGATPNLTMGTVTTLEPDSQATATITGTSENPVLNLGLPKGRTGEVSQAEFYEVAGDVEELKNTLTHLSNDIGITQVSYTSVSGKYISTDGVEASSAPFSHTNPFAVSKGDLVVAKATGYKTNVAMIATCNADLSNISVKVVSTDSTNRVYKYLCDADCYVVVSYSNASGAVITLKNAESNEQLNSRLTEIKSETEQIVEHSQNLLPVESRTRIVNGVTIDYSDGVFTLNGTATGSGGRNNFATPYFTLDPGTYALSGYDNNGGIDPSFFVQKDANNYFATVGHDLTSVFTVSDETPVFIGVNVITGNSYNGEQYKLQIIKSSSPSAFQKPSYATAVDAVARTKLKKIDEFWAYAMSKILCIGDSLTSGANYTGSWNGASIDQNYPRLLGRMLNADVANAGVSGITASGWYKDEISKYTLADYDAFIIWLGTNYGLTDTLDTDVNPYNDYNDYADTHTGNYCKIIEKIKEDKPSSLIVLVKIFATSGSMGVKVANEVIDKIAVKYGLSVIDNSDLTSSAYPNLHGNINNPHFSKAGNIFLANRFVTKIGSIIADNPLLADFGETARTN